LTYRKCEEERKRLRRDGGGKAYGLDQPKVSALVRGKVDGYSLDRLFRFLNALGQDIEINVRVARSRKTTGRRPGILVRY
jgi:hypothetical protein